MASPSSLPTANLIDTALLGGARSPQKFASKEQAMAKRLAQLHTALGIDSAHPPVTAASRPKTASCSTKLTSFILISLSAAMLGAGTMRLAQATNHPSTEQISPAFTTAKPNADMPGALPMALMSREADKERIEALLESWRQAWQAHDIKGYLRHYGDAFKPVDGSSRNTWIAARTKKLSTKIPITVSIKEIAMERIEPDLFKVSFVQSYASGTYNETGRGKTLLVSRENGEWKIVREQQD